MSTPETSPLPDLRFDVVDLVGRPGAHRDVSRTVEAPAAEEPPASMWVAEGEGIDVETSLESVVDGVYAGGTARTVLAGECSRCLDPLEEDVEIRFDELFTYPEKIPHEMSREERAELLVVRDDDVDLGPTVYDALVLAAPAAPLCSPDCLGLCAQCGIRLEDDPDHHHDVIDDRFAALQGFFAAGTDESATGENGTGETGSTEGSR